MWLYTKDGFYSAVELRGSSDHLLVRARVRQDIERLVAKVMEYTHLDHPIVETDGSDYRFRTTLPRDAWAWYVGNAAWGIDYHNFKGAALKGASRERSDAYHEVWFAMRELQRAGR